VKQLLSFIVFFLFFVCFAGKSEAVYDPLGVPNNKIGIHILFPDELDKARELVNTNGGEWGYVTIPIQGGDRDLAKWQNFMDNCKKLKLIPLVRLATQGDYFETASWSKPTEADIVDSANFLNSLEWPVKNRYIIVFNEVNRGDEWQGKAEPSEYAQILSYTTTVFKSKNQDFFIISSGMDNAAATDGTNYSQYDYFRLMDDAVPGIFNQIDGYSSHSYPNPAFSQPPGVNTPRSIYSFQYELNLIESMSNKKLPVFITETGWTRENFSDKQIGDFFKTAIEKPWNHEQIVAITPFLLRSGPGPFQKFSLIEESGDKNDIFRAIESLPKTKGKPVVNKNIRVLGSHEEKNLPLKDFSDNKESREGKLLKNVVKWLILTP
jgi:hypothetical protein